MKRCPFCERDLAPADPQRKPVTVFDQGYFVFCGNCGITLWVPNDGDPMPLPPDADVRIAEFGASLFAREQKPLAVSPEFHEFLAQFIPAASAALPSSPSS